MLTESCPEFAIRFRCENCHYYTNKKSSFEKHITTAKHLELTEVNQFSNKSCSKVANENNEFNCKTCNKLFKSRVGLWKHKKKCTVEIEKNICSEIESKTNEIHELKEIMKYLMKENSEMKNMMMAQNTATQNMMMDVIKTGTHNNTTNNNSHNKTFNLQFYLNETCKDAMNITDFVDSIQLQLSDLENVGRLGYVNGISKIIIKNLNALDETKRPIHCTDTKREILYVKDEDIWKKDNDDDKKCVKKAIKRIAYKNCKLIPDFREK
jgi:hypothetical protein